MIRVIPLLAVVFVLCFGAGVAQSDIFVRQGDDKANNRDSGGGNIFLRPFKKNDEDSKARNWGRDSSRTVVTNREQRIVNEDLRLLQAWHKADRKPQTAEELLSYARAHRAEAKMMVLQKRAKVVPAIEAARAKRLEDYQRTLLAEAGDVDAVIAFDSMMAGQRSSGSRGAYQAYGSQQPARKVRTIYRAPQKDEGPTRVFRDYR